MKKFLVDLYLPAAGKHLDVFLPENKQIGEVIKLLIPVAEKLSGGSYKGTPDSMLFDAVTGKPFIPQSTVKDVGIVNASRLILI